MIYRITHTTGYQYSSPASLSQNELYLFPRGTVVQKTLDEQLSIDPVPQYNHRRIDYFGNTVQLFMVQHLHEELTIISSSRVETVSPITPDPEKTLPWELAVARFSSHKTPQELEARQFLFESPLISLLPEARTFALQSFKPQMPLLAGAVDLVSRIYNEFTYDKTASTVDTTVDQIMQSRSGVCQDFAHLAISCLRSLGIAARYVSGYLETVPPPGKPRLVGSDASHAWFSLFIPDFGWVDLDPTNNLLVNETYITLAWGRDYGDVAPVKGVVLGGGIHKLRVTVDVHADTDWPAQLVKYSS